MDKYESSELVPPTFELKVAQPNNLTFILTKFVLIYEGKKVGQERVAVAFDIFFDTYRFFEMHQGEIIAGGPYTESSFAVDDLPSNFLGFMDGAGQISWKELCKPMILTGQMTEQEMLAFFDDGELYNEHVFAGVLPGPILPLTSSDHKPKLWDSQGFRDFLRSRGKCHPCEGKDTTIPSVFNNYVPGKHYGVDYIWLSGKEYYPWIKKIPSYIWEKFRGIL